MSFTPRKRFGQHFLHDPGTIERIIDAIAPRPADRMVEIGPGLGAITLPLLTHLAELHAIEIDRDAIRHLRETAPKPRAATATSFLRKQEPGVLHLHEANALEFDLTSLIDRSGSTLGTGDKLRIVGNLPYNISTPLLFHLLGQREHVLDMHFMLQKEVVARMAAKAGDDAYGRLTVMLAPWLEIEPLFDIQPGAFRPPPRVVSSFVRLTPHHHPPFVVADQRRFATVVAAAFSQRRKTLRNALKPLLSVADIEAVGIDPQLRAEVLQPASFAALAERLPARGAKDHSQATDD